MTHQPTAQKRRRRRRNERWTAMQFAKPFMEYRGRPTDDLKPTTWVIRDFRNYAGPVVRPELSIRMPEGI